MSTEVVCPHCGGPATEEIYWSSLPGQVGAVQKRLVRCASRPLRPRPGGKTGCPIWVETLEPLPAPAAPRVRRRARPAVADSPLEPALGLLIQLPDEVLDDVVRLARLQREAGSRLEELRRRLGTMRC